MENRLTQSTGKLIKNGWIESHDWVKVILLTDERSGYSKDIIPAQSKAFVKTYARLSHCYRKRYTKPVFVTEEEYTYLKLKDEI